EVHVTAMHTKTNEEKTFRVDYLLGCDGARSITRKMGIEAFLEPTSPSRKKKGNSEKSEWFVVDSVLDEKVQKDIQFGLSKRRVSSSADTPPPPFQFVCSTRMSGAEMALGNQHYRWEFEAACPHFTQLK